MYLAFAYVVIYGVTFLVLDSACWITERRSDNKTGASCVVLLLLYDFKRRKIRFLVAGSILLLSFVFGLYLILTQQAESDLLGVFMALVGWMASGELLDKWK